MDSGTLILLELLLVLGGGAAFALWQLRSLRKERERRDAGSDDGTR